MGIAYIYTILLCQYWFGSEAGILLSASACLSLLACSYKHHTHLQSVRVHTVCHTISIDPDGCCRRQHNIANASIFSINGFKIAHHEESCTHFHGVYKLCAPSPTWNVLSRYNAWYHGCKHNVRATESKRQSVFPSVSLFAHIHTQPVHLRCCVSHLSAFGTIMVALPSTTIYNKKTEHDFRMQHFCQLTGSIIKWGQQGHLNINPTTLTLIWPCDMWP